MSYGAREKALKKIARGKMLGEEPSVRRGDPGTAFERAKRARFEATQAREAARGEAEARRDRLRVEGEAHRSELERLASEADRLRIERRMRRSR